MSFPRYPRYKDSGVEWLGEVPEHWEVRRLGFYFDERRERVSDQDFPPLSVTKDGVVPQLETAAKSDDGENRKKVCQGDFVINSRSDRKGSSGVSELTGSVSLINTVLCPTAELAPIYAHHLLRSPAFQEEYYRFGKGIVADLWSTNYSEMRNISLALPPYEEQCGISNFLHHGTNKIGRLVAEQRRLITLLNEKRQATISRIVIKGLDPDAPMKPSGVEWMGEIPAHWKVLPIKRIIETIEQGWSPQCESYPAEGLDEWGVLKVGCVNGGEFRRFENKLLPAKLEPIPELGIRASDVLISRANTRDLVGSAAVAKDDHPRLMLCDKLYRLRLLHEQCLPEFLAYYLGSGVARGQIELGATGASASMLNISQSTILEMPAPVPPISVQHEIVGWLDERGAATGGLVAEAERAIALLQERRAALISAAVTGKIDVRGLTAD